MIQSHCYCLSGIIITIYGCLLIHALASPTVHPCRHDQREALLEFRDEFPTNKFNESPWNKSSDCCHWEGVTCDHRYGQVISLDLSDAFLNSSLKANSSLFRLQYLRHLNLGHCGLQGEIPSSLGNLSRLTLVDLSDNDLVGKIPVSIRDLNHLRELSFEDNNLIGEIPTSIGYLNHLRELSLWSNNLKGEIPSSIGNLSSLTDLSLSANLLVGEIPASIGNLDGLRVMDLSGNSLSGKFPVNLTKLTEFSLKSNNFTSTLPSDMSGFYNLEWFDVSYNSFVGPFPNSLFSIPTLQDLNLRENQFTGPLELGNTSFSSFELEGLDLSYNRFDGPIPEYISEFINLTNLHLDHNGFTGSIPKSLSKLVKLDTFHFSDNKLTGEIPRFIFENMSSIFSHNLFSSLENTTQEIWNNILDLSSNSFRGPFPHWICNIKGIKVLDLSNNFFNGLIPSCLRNNMFTLKELSLSNNSFSGFLPDIFGNATGGLRSFDVSRNQLEGKFPKSLINCKDLELVNVESNNFKDKFPSWLVSLPSLGVLSLRSNKFYGPLYHRHKSIGFQSLRVIDVSHNDFTGTLPPHYFSNWREMTTSTQGDDFYMRQYYLLGKFTIDRSIEMVIKGVDMRFERIREDFRAIDFSGNRFDGKIPVSIGFLKELRILNLSHNTFTEDIPRSLSNLTNLETLDLSSNNLSGEIPQDLGNLSFLSYMNFSHNRLHGPVPRGTQFQRQNCSSFTDNPGLFGLEEICGERHVPEPPTSPQHEDLSEEEEKMVNWIAAAIAYVPGVFCGLVIGYIFTSYKQEWFT